MTTLSLHASRRRLVACLGLFAALALASLAHAADRKLGTLGPPPRQDPQRQTSAESTAPLPLPATPLRRSEPKAEPAPPLFMGRLKYGSSQDYMPNPGDIDNLLRHVRYQLDAWYGSQVVDMGELITALDTQKPYQIPILYMTGYEAFEFTPKQREALRDYLINGGTLLGDAALGSPEFVKSFRAEVAKMFPDRKMDVLQLDHPIMRGYYTYSNIHYFTIEEGVRTKLESPPQFLGMNLAARTAVILSPYDMTCGWDGRYAPATPDRPKAAGAPSTLAMMPADAIRMGINIVAYVGAQRRFAKAQAVTREIVGDQPQRRAAVPIAILRHQGDWNPDPNALYQLIRLAAQNTSAPMQFDLRPVDAHIEKLLDTPLVVMTGMDDPKLTDDQVDALRRHVQAGGFLFINNTSGFALFDREARNVVARMFPEQKLVALPPEHEVFHTLYDAQTLRDAGTLKERPAELEAILIDGRAAVIYSKNDTLAMLKGVHDPYANAYDAESSRKLALDVLCYAMRH
ncbi:MAG: DUF4159 domain-containing protein [Planctomycetota bacterium]|nr:DUF4159 domain-containing protein [Planctomycetota bacterium]